MQQIDQPTAVIVRAIEPNVSVAAARHLVETRARLEQALLFAAVSMLWGLVLFSVLHSIG